MASYDAFTLGGPYSVRGFSVGELAACRRFAEAALELRMPLLGRQLFAFYETGTDLGAPSRQFPFDVASSLIQGVMHADKHSLRAGWRVQLRLRGCSGTIRSQHPASRNTMCKTSLGS